MQPLTDEQVKQWQSVNQTVYCKRMQATISKTTCLSNQRQGDRALKKLCKPNPDLFKSGERYQSKMMICAGCKNGVDVSRFVKGYEVLIDLVVKGYNERCSALNGVEYDVESEFNLTDRYTQKALTR
jgi:hypothetical protein